MIVSAPIYAAGDSLFIDAVAQYNFARKLFQQEDYASCIVEFRRFAYFFPKDSRTPEAEAYIGLAQLNSGQYKKAISSFETLIDRYEAHLQALLAYFHISDCYLQLQEPQQAMITLQNLTRITQNTEILDKAYHKMGWIAVEAGGWLQAASIFNRITPSFRQEKGINGLIEDLTSKKELSYKKPTLAGALSVVPGAGQLYCGRYRDALSAFLVNGGLIWAAVDSFDKEFYALGATITFFEFGFYTANIYGAVTSAHKYNQRQIENYSHKLHKQYRIGLLPIRNNDGIMLSFQYVY